MPPDALATLVEAVRQLSTEVVVLFAFGLFAQFFLATVFSLDLLAILLSALLRRYAEHHVALRPMAQALGRPPPYNRADRNAVFATFLKGKRASGVRPSPPTPSRP